jgi:branched-chain amino acid transport system substrate-binding protein
MSKTLKWVIAIVVIILIIAGVWYLGVKSTTAPSVETGPIKIGVISPMTGSAVGVYHEPLKKGIDIALQEIGEDSKIELIYQDDQLDAKQALSAYNLLKMQGVKYFILNDSPAAATVGPEIVKDGNFSLVPSALVPSYKDESPLTCRIALTADNYGPALAELVFNKLGKKKVASIYPNSEGSVAVEKAFREKFESLGGQVIREETFVKEDSDFRTQLTKIKGSKEVEAIVVMNWFSTVELMFKQMKELAINKPVISETWTIKNKDLKDLSLVDDVSFVDYSYSSEETNLSAVAKGFVVAYEQAYGEKPGLQSVQGYDTMRLLAHAIKNTNPVSPSALANFFVANVKNYQLAGGSFSFNDTCEVSRDIVIRKVKDGKFILAK